MSGDARRSELYSSINGPAELHGGSAAGELESPEDTPKPAQGEFVHATPDQQAQGLGLTINESTRRP